MALSWPAQALGAHVRQSVPPHSAASFVQASLLLRAFAACVCAALVPYAELLRLRARAADRPGERGLPATPPPRPAPPRPRFAGLRTLRSAQVADAVAQDELLQLAFSVAGSLLTHVGRWLHAPGTRPHAHAPPATSASVLAALLDGLFTQTLRPSAPPGPAWVWAVGAVPALLQCLAHGPFASDSYLRRVCVNAVCALLLAPSGDPEQLASQRAARVKLKLACGLSGAEPALAAEALGRLHALRVFVLGAVVRPLLMEAVARPSGAGELRRARVCVTALETLALLWRQSLRAAELQPGLSTGERRRVLLCARRELLGLCCPLLLLLQTPLQLPAPRLLVPHRVWLHAEVAGPGVRVMRVMSAARADRLDRDPLNVFWALCATSL